MGLESIILTKIDPKLTPPSLDILDLEKPDGDVQRTPDRTGYADQLGKKSPLIKIGNARIASTDIISASIYYDDFIPKIHVSIFDSIGTFTSVTFPKKNPLLTIYIAKSHAKLNELCQTFLITDIQSIPMSQSTIRYDFYGELYIPKLNGNFIKSYSNMTSQEALQQIARELEIGYASNEETFDDKMTWINPNLNYKSFIKTIADHSFKNKDSFFECFIDRYYTLCLVNVENQLKPFDSDKDIPMGYAATSTEYIDLSLAKDASESLSIDEQVPIILTNGSSLGAGSDFTIVEYSMMSENGSILKRSGFRKRLQMYQHGEEEALKDWFVEPLSTVSPDGEQVHQTPDLTDYTDEGNEVVKWMGTDYGNSHLSYKYAKLVNHHNREETEKHLMRVKLDGINHNISRGARVAVDIYGDRLKRASDDSTKDELIVQDSQQDRDKTGRDTASAQIKDEYLSGAYYVKSIEYHYNAMAEPRQKFSTVMMLSRRSWLPEPKMENKI
jgi:hypothetical protein